MDSLAKGANEGTQKRMTKNDRQSFPGQRREKTGSLEEGKHKETGCLGGPQFIYPREKSLKNEETTREPICFLLCLLIVKPSKSPLTRVITLLSNPWMRTWCQWKSVPVCQCMVNFALKLFLRMLSMSMFPRAIYYAMVGIGARVGKNENKWDMYGIAVPKKCNIRKNSCTSVHSYRLTFNIFHSADHYLKVWCSLKWCVLLMLTLYPTLLSLELKVVLHTSRESTLNRSLYNVMYPPSRIASSSLCTWAPLEMAKGGFSFSPLQSGTFAV